MSPENIIIRKGISSLLIAVLVLTGLFSFPRPAYAAKKILSDTVYYHLDMGVQVTYQGNEWEALGLDYGDTEDFAETVSFPNDVEVLDAYPLSSSKGSSFSFGEITSSTNIPKALINESGSAEYAYEQFYKESTSTSMSARGTPSASGNEVTFSYRAKLETSTPLDVVSYGYNEYDDEIWKLFGGINKVYDADVKAAIENALLQGRNNTANGNRLYLVFCPTVIKYKKYITVGDLEASLALPSSAKQGESYTASDDSYVDSLLTVDYAVLEKNEGDGIWEKVITWNGAGAAGRNTGGSIEETSDDIGTVTYRLTVTSTDGQTDTDVKTINITDGREIIFEADLILPACTYEGHTELAQDQSTFEVDGITYSTARAYAENIARNSFRCASSYADIEKLTDTKANITFSKTGTYNVTLTVKTATGGTDTDTESIEVRKTPYIIDNLSGFQKQNRKQILTATVATYPGKPLTDYSVTIKDKVTGNSVTLTPDNPQENNSTIKTRSVTMTQDVEKGFAYITAEFLTKTPGYFSTGTNPQDFYYEINVEDSKGDSDKASKTFAVSPDLPPTAAISIDTAFLRNEKSNVASITAEDVTVAADGDDAQRTWYYAPGITSSSFANVSVMDGYKKLSFGTDKIVGFNKAGVGKFTAKLDVKEVWTQPTLEEYVTDSDRLTGTATAASDVQNVAPVVSLELLNSTDQEILLLANNNTEYQTLTNRKTELQQALLTNQIDGQIIIKKLIGNTPANVTGVALRYNARYPYDYNSPGEGNILAVDSERTYLLTYTWTGSGLGSTATVPKTIHAIDPNSGEVWSYTTSRNESFTFGQDDIGKYLYLIYSNSNQTVLIDKRTGAEAGTINMALSDKMWLSDSLAFIVENKNLYALNLNTLTKTLVAEGAEAVSRVGGNLQFIKKTNSAIIRGILDMETLTTEKNIVIETGSKSSPNNYTGVCIDSTGKIVLWKDTGTGTDRFRGMMSITADNKVATKAAVDDSVYSAYDLVYALDEQGRCNYVMEREKETSGTDTYYARGFNMNTGAVSYYSDHSTNFALCSYQGAFESKGTAYFMFSGEDTYYGKNGASYWWNPAYIFQVSGSGCSFGFYGPGFNLMDENMKASDRMAASIDGENKPGDGKLYLRILTYSKTLAQEAAEIISRFTDKLTFVGDVNTTANAIKAAAETQRPIIKVTASQNGYLSLENQSFDEMKKYHYEYEIKPLTKDTESKLTGLSASTPAFQSNQPFLSDTYYVDNTYFDDFNDGNVNKFFTLASLEIWDTWGAFGANCYEDDTEVGSASLTFTVPAGKKAILSYDYAINVEYVSGISGFGTYVDSEPAYADYPVDADKYGVIWHHYTHYKILSEGTHTISCVGDNPGLTLIDNLKVDILSTNKPLLRTTLNTEKENQTGWLSVAGSFETPNGTISYGAQGSYYYSGGIAAEVKGTYNNGAPRLINYYQTVPAGYLQKGFAYPTGSCGNKDQLRFSIAGIGNIRMGKWADIYSGQKMRLGVRQEGTITHSAQAGGKNTSATIPRFDLITYPVNEVTLTEQISFSEDFTKYFFPKETSTKQTNLSIYLPRGDYLIKNFRLYYIESGQKIYLQNVDCEELSDLSKWSLSNGLSASVITPTEEKTNDEYIKIYKKGEKVLYNIFYDDYEEDPSKTGYWIYTHLNWPPDTVHPDVGKVLTAPIDRFYLSGKYTVTHWEVDNTQRPGTVGDATPYNKESNKVTMTFYVDGEGKAPWITYIKTNPTTIKENNSYTIHVGVDDTEKDPLRLETEVYRNGILILSDTKTGIAADISGSYPEQTISGLPGARAGVYQVICTVSDSSGTGVKSYKFTVVSEGRITGVVNHTDQWDANRKKYNLKRFSDEVNRILSLSDYKAMSMPRMRGTNVFWSGEKFMLRAETEGEPTGVTVQILFTDPQGNLKSTGYSTSLTDTGRSTIAGAELWEGSLWKADMINKWGRKNPEELTFRFTADYAGGATKTHTATVIMDSDRDYWQLHRLW